VTGGLVGARLTGIPGASDVFRGAIVSYATEVKQALLDVGDGPVVSEAAARQMAHGVRERLGADIVAADARRHALRRARRLDEVRHARVPGPRRTVLGDHGCSWPPVRQPPRSISDARAVVRKGTELAVLSTKGHRRTSNRTAAWANRQDVHFRR
jgi:hypothetical protein